MDQERYIPGDKVLHPGTGRTEYYQDANGAVFRQIRYDAHGNNFTTNYALDPAKRYGYSGPEAFPRTSYGTDPAAHYGYTVLGGRHQPRPRRSAPYWRPRPASAYVGSDIGSRISAATSEVTGSVQSGGDDGAGLLFAFFLALLVAGLPLGAAYLIRRRAKASGRDATTTAIAVGLAEPAWLLLLWSWLRHGALWPAAVALLLPIGYAGYVRRRAQFQ